MVIKGETFQGETEEETKELVDPDQIDWPNVDRKDLDAVRELLGHDKEEFQDWIDDLLVRDMSGAIKDAQLLKNDHGASTLPDALRERREMLEVTKDIWDNRDQTSTVQWDGTERGIQELDDKLKELNKFFMDSWDSRKPESFQAGMGIIDRALVDGDASLQRTRIHNANIDKAVQDAGGPESPAAESLLSQKRGPTPRMLERIQLLEGFKAYYETESDKTASTGERSERDPAREANLSTQEGFETAAGIEEGSVDDVVSDAARSKWQEQLEEARQQGGTAWDDKVAELRREIDFVQDDGAAQQRVAFPDGPLEGEEGSRTLTDASLRLNDLKQIFNDSWNNQDPSLRYTEGINTISGLIESAERRINTAQRAISTDNEVADITKESLAATMLTLEGVADKYAKRQPDPESDQSAASQQAPQSPDQETGSRQQTGNQSDTQQASSQGQDTDQKTSTNLRQEIFSSETDGGPGAKDPWNLWNDRLYNGLRVRNKRAAESFRKGDLLSTDNWWSRHRQETDVRAVAATLADQTRWRTQPEREQRSQAAAYQMLARESYKQEERQAERAYSNWVPNRPENMSRQELWDVLNENERDYFRDIFQDVAKQLEMAADPNVKWSNKDAAKAIKTVMKEAENFLVSEGITDKRGYMLRTPRPRAAPSGEGETFSADDPQQPATPEHESDTRQQRQDDDSRRQEGASEAETGQQQNSDQNQSQQKRQSRWDFQTVSGAVADKDVPAGMEYLKRLIADEMTGGRQPEGPREVYADALTEKYRDRLYEAASEKDQANFSQAVADMRGEILVLQGAQSLADRPQIDEESIQSWKADGPIGSGLRASAESAPDSDTRQMQMQLLDKLPEGANPKAHVKCTQMP